MELTDVYAVGATAAAPAIGTQAPQGTQSLGANFSTSGKVTGEHLTLVAVLAFVGVALLLLHLE